MKVNASARTVQGSSASRRLRRAGRVPAIVYGAGQEPVSIELDHNEIFHALRRPEFHASILDLQLEGKRESVLLRAVQWHPYKPQVLHVDFQRVAADQPIETRVPLNFINGDESPAVKLAGEVISHVLTELNISCLPKDLPTSIDVDLSELPSGGSLHLEQITLPPGVTYVPQGAEHNPVLAVALAVGSGAASNGDEGSEGAAEDGSAEGDSEA